MKKFLELGNRYAKQSDWKDFALTKFCLCAMGILIGLHIPEKHKKPAVLTAGAMFLATYIPLMSKVFCIAKGMFTDNSNFSEDIFEE